MHPAHEIINTLEQDQQYAGFASFFKTPQDKERFVRGFRLMLASNSTVTEKLKEYELKPEALTIFRKSLFKSLYEAAHDGIIIDGEHGALNFYNSKVKIKGVDTWVSTPVYLPMVKGVRKKVFDTTGIIMKAVLVYENDEFIWEEGFSETIKHIPTKDENLGKITHVYALAKKDDKITHYVVMRIGEVEKIKQKTKSKDKDGKIIGIWVDHYEEMVKKTAIHRLAKELPLSEQVDRIINRDNEHYEDIQVESPQVKIKTLDGVIQQDLSGLNELDELVIEANTESNNE